MTDRPFRHLVIDGYLPAEHCAALCALVPPPEWEHWVRYHQVRDGEFKRTCRRLDCLPVPLADLIFRLGHDALPAPVRLPTVASRCTTGDFGVMGGRDLGQDWAPWLWGYSDLRLDPTLHGAGLHVTERGGSLGVHRDYYQHPHCDLRRAVSLVLYLSPWEPGSGGELELWGEAPGSRPQTPAISDLEPGKRLQAPDSRPQGCRRDPSPGAWGLEPRVSCGLEPVVRIEPLPGRLVLFEGGDRSWHGHPRPWAAPAGRAGQRPIERVSVALYYLSRQPPRSERTRAEFAAT